MVMVKYVTKYTVTSAAAEDNNKIWIRSLLHNCQIALISFETNSNFNPGLWQSHDSITPTGTENKHTLTLTQETKYRQINQLTKTGQQA